MLKLPGSILLLVVACRSASRVSLKTLVLVLMIVGSMYITVACSDENTPTVQPDPVQPERQLEATLEPETKPEASAPTAPVVVNFQVEWTKVQGFDPHTIPVEDGFYNGSSDTGLYPNTNAGELAYYFGYSDFFGDFLNVTEEEFYANLPLESKLHPREMVVVWSVTKESFVEANAEALKRTTPNSAGKAPGINQALFKYRTTETDVVIRTRYAWRVLPHLEEGWEGEPLMALLGVARNQSDKNIVLAGIEIAGFFPMTGDAKNISLDRYPRPTRYIVLSIDGEKTWCTLNLLPTSGGNTPDVVRVIAEDDEIHLYGQYALGPGPSDAYWWEATVQKSELPCY